MAARFARKQCNVSEVMSISFFIPNAPKRWVSALEEFPNLDPDDFRDDPFIKWKDDVPYIEKSSLPDLNVSIYTYHRILKNALYHVVDDKEHLEEGWGSWENIDDLKKAKYGLLAYLSTGARNDVREEIIEGNVVIAEYDLERIERIIYKLISVIDAAIEYDMEIIWG